MKDFFSDLFYYCSAANTRSRGFYIFVTALLFIIPVAVLASIIMMFVNGFAVLNLVLIIVGVLAEAGVVFWLAKSE